MKRKYIYGFIILVAFMMAICVMSAVMPDDSQNSVYAETEQQTYELKIKLFNEYYWVESDSSLSSTAVSLTVGADFDIETFTDFVSSGQWYPEGKYIKRFVYDGTSTQCFFANNKVLSLGEEQVYTIEPDYEKEKYTFYFNTGWEIETSFLMQTYTIGDNLELPEFLEFPTKENSEGTKYDYILKGWYLEEELFAKDETVVIPDMSPDECISNKTITLTAKWIAPFYNVDFHMSSEEDDVISAEVFYNQSIEEVFPYINDNGYAFLGFAFSEGGVPEVLDGDYIWLKETDADLYCIRSEIPTQYKISYNGNGGTITGATSTYNVTDLPLKLSYNAYREFDHLNGFTLNNVYLGTDAKDVLPVGTIGNINLKAQWKAYRTSSSSSIFVTSETYSNEYTIVDCRNMSLLAARTITIAPTVKEITFIGNYSNLAISKNIIVENDDLIINLKNIKWQGKINTPLIDASTCDNLTLNCVGQNKLSGGPVSSKIDISAVISCRNLIISGQHLIIEGSTTLKSGMSGCNGIFAVGDDNPNGFFPYSVEIDIAIDYLMIQGGKGAAGDQFHKNGTEGGYAIACWGVINIENKQGQEVYLISGEGGAGYDGGVNGEKPDAVYGGVIGDYNSSV